MHIFCLGKMGFFFIFRGLYFFHFLVEQLSTCLSPFKQMPDFAVIQPEAVRFAAVHYYPALMAEIDPVHQDSADWTSDILEFPVVRGTLSVCAGDLLIIDFKNLGHRAFEESFNLTRIKKKAVAGSAPFDQKITAWLEIKVDGLQREVAVRADAW
jgi:hypothetical protein